MRMIRDNLSSGKSGNQTAKPSWDINNGWGYKNQYRNPLKEGEYRFGSSDWRIVNKVSKKQRRENWEGKKRSAIQTLH